MPLCDGTLAHMPDLSLLPIADDDLPFVREMLYAAAFWRQESGGSPVDEALRKPDLARYVESWGRPGDRGLVAHVSGTPAGAAWVRLFNDEDHGYGYVDDRTPELSVAVAEDHRGCGIGRCLVIAMLTQARLDGATRVSLSVEPDNPARSLYESLGFERVDTVDGALTMVRKILSRSWPPLRPAISDGG